MRKRQQLCNLIAEIGMMLEPEQPLSLACVSTTSLAVPRINQHGFLCPLPFISVLFKGESLSNQTYLKSKKKCLKLTPSYRGI